MSGTPRGAIAPTSGTGASPGRPCRILLIEANEDGTVGGSHQALYDFARHLDRSRYEPVLLFYQENRFASQLREEGFEVHLYEPERGIERAIRASSGRIRRTLDIFGAIARRRDFLERHRIDLVHINNSPAVGNDDWLPAARLRRIPVLANAMGDARGARGGRVHAWLFRRFDRVLPISAFMTEAMVTQGIPRDRLTPIRLGVDLAEIRARVRRGRDEVRRELGLRDDQLLVAMVGNVREWKGQHVMLEALGHLAPDERDRLHVAFAGAVHEDGRSYKATLDEIEQRLDVGRHVSWLGARRDVPDLFAAADLAAHCSVRPEPFGLVVTEAMALGTPVAATNFGGPAEVVTPESGWLYDATRPEELAAILRSVLENPTELERKAEGARRRAQDYSVERTVERTLEAYRAVLGG